MQLNKIMFRTALAVSMAVGSVSAQQANNPYEIDVDASQLKLAAEDNGLVPYIVQVKGKSGVEKAQELGELLPAKQMVTKALNRYNAASDRMQSYTNALKSFHQQLAIEGGAAKVIYSYTHTFNGFSAKLTAAQAEALRNHPNIEGVWRDEVQQMATSNTPAFLGLTDSQEGLHTLGVKGEDVVIGIVDSGIWPEHPSFADDGSYAPLAGWGGSCDVGDDVAFSCNNKLIGARYFKNTFESVYAIQPGEFISPRDADNHGSHTSSTAAGNEGVSATVGGLIGSPSFGGTGGTSSG